MLGPNSGRWVLALTLRTLGEFPNFFVPRFSPLKTDAANHIHLINYVNEWVNIQWSASNNSLTHNNMPYIKFVILMKVMLLSLTQTRSSQMLICDKVSVCCKIISLTFLSFLWEGLSYLWDYSLQNWSKEKSQGKIECIEMNEKIQHTNFYWIWPVTRGKYIAEIIDYTEKDLKTMYLPP